ncbi:hypothetical protein PCANC_02134 [Puccinia coronata f. sp. avenae]|uniref:Uncharacterized protein n=1 Tax=Puccinia coronata f. sp. avenae TaxID=200324 RepID=A0A2N5VZU9_9BASI|nr:hypothetical protein PCASD_21844 [Puccinia coronata f. sp. avenae]PLW55487.1 hypothetical protein PCANC_02134 [Puccinia coronata f. sp. avenae]
MLMLDSVANCLEDGGSVTKLFLVSSGAAQSANGKGSRSILPSGESGVGLPMPYSPYWKRDCLLRLLQESKEYPDISRVARTRNSPPKANGYEVLTKFAGIEVRFVTDFLNQETVGEHFLLVSPAMQSPAYTGAVPILELFASDVKTESNSFKAVVVLGETGNQTLKGKMGLVGSRAATLKLHHQFTK